MSLPPFISLSPSFGHLPLLSHHMTNPGAEGLFYPPTNQSFVLVLVFVCKQIAPGGGAGDQLLVAAGRPPGGAT